MNHFVSIVKLTSLHVGDHRIHHRRIDMTRTNGVHPDVVRDILKSNRPLN